VNLEALFEAIKQGDAAAVRSLVDQDPALLESSDAQGVSAVLQAVYYGRKEILHELLARNPRLSVFEASAAGQAERVREWVSKDPGLAFTYSQDGYTALGLASFFGHLEIVTLLLGRGAEVNVVSRNDMAVRPLHSAAAGRHLAVAQVLLAHGADVHAKSHGGWTALHSAADHGQIEFIRTLLEHGARPDVRNDEGLSPLDLARRGAHSEVADLLARRGG
jgi:ankyrin repeat protein